MKLHVVVVGAGAFGGWTALMLRRAGAAVTLVDAWGPGHARASSGGETRIIRGTYGDRAIYTHLAARAMRLWQEHDARTQRQFFHRTGALWLFSGNASFGEQSVEPMRAAGLPVEWLDPADARARWPQVGFTGVTHVLWEPEAGFALARRACENVVETLVAEGGQYLVGQVRSPEPAGGTLRAITLDDGRTLAPIASHSRAVPGWARCCPTSSAHGSARHARSRSTSPRLRAMPAGCHPGCRCGWTTATG